MPTRIKVNVFVLFCLVAMAAPAADDAMQQRFVTAQYNFDRALAEKLLPEFELAAKSQDSEQGWIDYATAALLVAELKRGDYEHQPLARKARRQLGRDIDRVASNALTALEALPARSERYRLEADLLGTMIRSKFQGMQYQPRLEQAIDKALQLDANNAGAWVSLARRPLFASTSQGGDPELALQHLNRALKINPEHLQALLFRAVAHSKLGEMTSAEADWAQAAALNPNTANARDRLLSIAMPSFGDDTPP